jgi:hypothetical protein
MHQYKVYIMREEEKALFQEGSVTLAHLTPPQFKLGDKTALTEEQVRSLLRMAAAGAEGCRLKTDLVTYSPIPITAPEPQEG